MKRKLTFALLAISAVGVGLSCFSIAQDPFAAEQAPAAGYAITRSGSGDALYTSPIANVFGAASSTTVQGESALARNVSTLAKQLKSAEGAEKESVTQKLKTAVGEQFDFRHAGKDKELKALEEQLAKLKEIHNKRTQQRDRIIADRVQQILLEVESLGWGLSDGSESTNVYTTSSGWDNAAPRGFGVRNGLLAPAIAPSGSAPAIIAPTSNNTPAVRSPGQPSVGR